MAWAAAFITTLERDILTPGYIIEPMTFDSVVTVPGGAPALSTARLTGYERVLDTREIFLGEERVDPRTWHYTGGAWMFIARWRTTTQRETILNAIERGTPLVLKMGGASYAVGDYEVLRKGVVESITESGRAITVRMWDILTTLRTRVTQASWPVLFANVSAGTAVLTAAYTPGDTTLTVDTTVGFERDSGHVYLVKVTPTTGDPFWLTAGSKTGTTFSVTALAQFGTTAGAAGVGQAVVSVALVSGTPFEIASKVLVSTGTAGTHGTDDVLPESWGYAWSDEYIDSADMTVWNNQIAPSSGAHAWDWINEVGIDNGLRTLLDLFGQVGLWLANRQGQIVGRAVQDIRGGGSITETGITITDRNLCEVSKATVEWRDPDQGFEWLGTRVNTATGDSGLSTRSANLTWPFERYYEADLTTAVWTNEANQNNAYNERIKRWYVAVPERLRIRLAGLEWMRLCCGDVLRINSKHFRGHFVGTATLDGSVPYMIAAIKPDVRVGYVDIELLTPPEDATDERE